MADTRWFTNARFGMFIHWGLYSIIGRGEWVMFHENIPVDEYSQYAHKFNPKKFNAMEWVLLAKKAGMQYMVLTTRHHDGFSLFDSKVSDFTSVKTAAKKDFVAKYVSACRKVGMKIGFYYSLINWRWPVAYEGPKENPHGWQELVEHVHAQVKELCTNYGKIDIMWYDGGFYIKGRGTCLTTADDWQAEKLNAMVRRYQPHIIINNRSGIVEDFDTPEQHIQPSKPGRTWESCMTMNNHWGYFTTDSFWKYAKELIHNLTACISGGGNYLLNVGPKPEGTISVQSISRLHKIGKWLRINGDAIYGAGACEIEAGTAGVFTSKGENLYLMVHWWPGKVLCLPSVNIKIKSAYILSTKQKVKLEQRGERLILRGLPAKAPDPLCSVIVMKR